MTDIGTGTYAILTQIAGEMLGLPMDKIKTTLGDSDLPEGPGSGGSWGTSSSGSAVYLACEEIREKIGGRIDCDPDDLVLKDGCVKADKQTHSLTDILGGEEITAQGHIIPGATAEDVSQASYGATGIPSPECRLPNSHGCNRTGRNRTKSPIEGCSPLPEVTRAFELLTRFLQRQLDRSVASRITRTVSCG